MLQYLSFYGGLSNVQTLIFFLQFNPSFLFYYAREEQDFLTFLQPFMTI